MGGVLYADDLALLAPSRAILADMLALVEAHGASLNLVFSTSQDPKKCKTFCLYYVGPRPDRRIQFPTPLVLNGVVLPWVRSAVHLGHTLHQDLTMTADAAVRRARFISSSVEVGSPFFFATPAQILRAVKALSCDAYGSVLWRLESEASTSFYKAYSSCVRRVFRLPQNTFTYLVEGHLSLGITPLRNMVLGRFPPFFQKMAWGPSREVAIMAEISAKDQRTVTACNLAHVSTLTGLNSATAGWQDLKAALPVQEVPDKEKWRLGLLDSLLRERTEQENLGLDTRRVVAMLSSLCST